MTHSLTVSRSDKPLSNTWRQAMNENDFGQLSSSDTAELTSRTNGALKSQCSRTLSAISITYRSQPPVYKRWHVNMWIFLIISSHKWKIKPLGLFATSATLFMYDRWLCPSSQEIKKTARLTWAATLPAPSTEPDWNHNSQSDTQLYTKHIKQRTSWNHETHRME